ncbi:O-antigen ligase family protein [Patescibacteria group bacterium]|nr:O-antigen ligase family protein [Patescibacteria group bacterium]
MNAEKILKYIIWIGLISICFIPLLVRSNYYFPFIVPKTIAFRVIVEIIFLAFLGLAVLKKEYRLKINLVLVLFFSYLITVFLSSALAGTFQLSFWSNNERSEGLLLMVHLFLFLLVLSSFLRKIKDWMILFEFSFLSSLMVSFVALGQHLNWSWLMESSGGERLASTLGNAGYVAGYLIFNIFFGLILFFFRESKYLSWFRAYYILGILLQIFVVFNTLTRGGIIALGFSVFVLICYFVFYHYKSNKLIRNSGFAVLLLMIAFSGFLFLNKQANWVKENNVLEKIVSISPKAVTAENRLLTWYSAYQGFKEKPILGYGYENFYQVFDKYFNPKIYRKAGSVVWFDRGHNIIADRLITGGLIGLLLYLAVLFAPLFYLWKRFIKSKENNNYLMPTVFTLVMLAYFIQNLFIFEALVTYIPLFIVLGFLSQFCPNYFEKFAQSKKPYLVLLTIGVIAFLPVLFSVNIRMASANKGLIDAMIKTQQKETEVAYTQFINVIEMNTSYNQEYRQHFAEFVTGSITSDLVETSWQKMAALRTIQELDKQIEEKPKSARNYLMFMRFLNKTYNFNVEWLNKSLKIGEKAAQLSPTRPQIYNEMAYSQIYLGKYYESIGETEKANQVFNESVVNTEKALALNESVMESYINVIMILFTVGQNDKVQFYLDKMDEIGLNYHREDVLERMVNSAVYAKDYNWAAKFNKKLTEVVPDNPDHWIDLALSYAYLDQKEKAVETAERVKEFGGEYVTQSDLFIQDILAGKYEQQ